MTGIAAMRACFDAVTVNAARLLGLEGYGLEPGCNGDLVVLQARDPIEAIRLRAARLCVVRRGKVVAESPAQTRPAPFAGTARRHQFHRLRVGLRTDREHHACLPMFIHRT